MARIALAPQATAARAIAMHLNSLFIAGLRGATVGS